MSNEERKQLAIEPWHKFKRHTIILKDEAIANPDYGNGLIKKGLFNFYDDGLLVFNSECSREIKVRLRNGEIIHTTAYVLDEVPFRNMVAFDEYGSVNNPFPTIYCQFRNGHPFAGIRYIDTQTAMNYDMSQIIEPYKEINSISDEDIERIFEDERTAIDQRLKTVEKTVESVPKIDIKHIKDDDYQMVISTDEKENNKTC